MTQDEIIATYNPENAASLTDEQKAGLANLTTEDFAALAKQYPNNPKGNAYLVLRDKRKKDSEQLFALSTWANIADLHRIGQTYYSVAGFSKDFRRPQSPVKTAAPQDLTREQALSELKTATPQTLAPGTEGSNDASQSQDQNKLGNDGTNETTGNQQSQGNEQKNEGFDETVPLDKMLKAGLQEKYAEVLGEDAPANFTKEQLIAAIEAKQNK